MRAEATRDSPKSGRRVATEGDAREPEAILADPALAAVIDMTEPVCLLLVSMLLLSPMSSQSHYVALIPAIFAVVAVWLKGDPPVRRIAAFVLIAHVVLTNATSKDLVGAAITFWAKEYRLLISDALLLVVFFAILVFRPRPAPAKGGVPSAVGQSTA